MFVFSWIIILVVLLFLSACISAAEIGITSLSKYRLKKLIVQFPKLSKSLFSWLKQPHYLLTIILTINVVVDMLTSFFSTDLLIHVFYMVNRNIVEIFSWIVTSFVILVFGEIVPKIYARFNSEKVTLKAVPILSKLESLLKPFIYPIIKITEFLVPKTSDKNYSYALSDEEVENILSEGTQTGELDKETSSMLKRTLKFEDLNVEKIMVPFSSIESVDLSLDENEFLDKAIETSRSRIPVYIKSKDNIIGYVHIKDILVLWEESKGRFIRSLVKEPYYVGQNQKINELLKQFQSGKTHIAFVKDNNNNIIGMVTLEDVLEEVVGEILDEYELKQ
ncbi:MAG: hemolysin family protein [Endomicrobium sp.]|jgi:CBS domain containing-hemolysin-like protein|nr:hemolysin family protein [Endomicrobium sp.]